jgi:hypothetical protein
MSILAWIVLGLIAGFIGSKLVNKTGEGVLLAFPPRVWPCSLDSDPKTLKKVTIPRKNFFRENARNSESRTPVFDS